MKKNLLPTVANFHGELKNAKNRRILAIFFNSLKLSQPDDDP